MKKRIISMSLAFVMSFSAITSVFANELSVEERKALDRQETSISQLSAEEIQLKKETVKVPESLDYSVHNYVKSESEFWSVLSENLPTDSYGGMYVRDGVLHIKTVENNDVPIIRAKVEQIEEFIDLDVKDSLNLLMLEPINNYDDILKIEDASEFIDIDTNEVFKDDISILNESNSIIIIENDATYTISDFEKAMDNLWEAKAIGEIDLIGTGIYESKNSLFVEAKKWDAESQEKVLEITGIDKEHVIFEISDGEFEDLALSDAIPGSHMTNDYNNLSSLGCGVYYEVSGLSEGSGDYGFITAGHGLDEGDDMYVYNYAAGFVDFINIGPVNGNRYAYADIAVVYKSSDPDNNKRYPATFTLNTSDGKIILNTGRAVEGDRVVMFGASSGKRTGEVLSASYQVEWNGSGPGTYKYMIKTDITSAGGDSGGPLLRLSSNGSYYSMLGILKGRESKDNQAVFTSWKCIESYLEYGSKGRAVEVWLWP